MDVQLAQKWLQGRTEKNEEQNFYQELENKLKEQTEENKDLRNTTSKLSEQIK